jgi:hypothetical protein
MEAFCTDEELERLLQDFDKIPPSSELYGLNFDPTLGTLDPFDPNMPFKGVDHLLRPGLPEISELSPPIYVSLSHTNHKQPMQEAYDRIRLLEEE